MLGHPVFLDSQVKVRRRGAATRRCSNGSASDLLRPPSGRPYSTSTSIPSWVSSISSITDVRALAVERRPRVAGRPGVVDEPAPDRPAGGVLEDDRDVPAVDLAAPDLVEPPIQVEIRRRCRGRSTTVPSCTRPGTGRADDDVSAPSRYPVTSIQASGTTISPDVLAMISTRKLKFSWSACGLTVPRPLHSAHGARRLHFPRGFELPLEPRLPRIGSIDAVARRGARRALAKRSIKKEAKLFALELAIRMMDLTTLEGADTPGKVAALARRRSGPIPTDPSIPSVAAVCVYPNLVPTAVERLRGTGVNVASVATAFPSGQSPIAREGAPRSRTWSRWAPTRSTW